MIDMKVVPIYQHDCDRCEFIGRFALKDGVEFDIYTCYQGGELPTTVIRFGDDGTNYMSGDPVNLYQLGIGISRIKDAESAAMVAQLRAMNIENEERIELEEPWHGEPWPKDIPFG